MNPFETDSFTTVDHGLFCPAQKMITLRIALWRYCVIMDPRDEREYVGGGKHMVSREMISFRIRARLRAYAGKGAESASGEEPV